MNLHLEQVGRASLISSGLSQRLDDVGLLEILEMRGEIQPRIRQIELSADPLRVIVGYVLRQPFRLNLVPAFESDGPLDRMFQLSNISTPHIILQKLHRLRSNIERPSRL